MSAASTRAIKAFAPIRPACRGRWPITVRSGRRLWGGVIWIAEKFYQWISRNRYLLSRVFGCKEACSIMPMRQRANEEQIRTK